MIKNVNPCTRDGNEPLFDPILARYVKIKMLTNSANPRVRVNELMVVQDERETQ